MPVSCPIQITDLSTDQFRDLDYLVMRHAFDSQNSLGRLADERIYQNDLLFRLRGAGLNVKREVPVFLSHGEFRKTLLLDVVVAEQAVYELKVVRKLSDAHFGQLLTYLHLLELTRGKLINFRPAAVESQFVNAPITGAERRGFKIEDSKYVGADDFRDLVVGLIRDWGTSLTLLLYQEALGSLLGGADKVEEMLPLTRNGEALGNQRFLLVSSDTAFRLTAMNHETSDYRKQLQRLLSHSPLRSIHWVNISHHQVTLTTIQA